MKLDIIHSLDAYPWGIYGKFLASKLGIPHIMTAHGRYGFIANYRLMDRILYKRILEDCSAIVAVSAAVKKEILKYFSNYIEQENIHVLHNAVNISGFKIIDNKVPIERNDFPTIISVTRFIACKGIETSLRAFKIVRSQIPNSQYLLVGPGNHEKNQYYRNITELIRTENINGVKIVGRVSKSDLSRYYISSDLLLHTPITLEDDFEAYGLILLEAGLFKLPVVATRSGGVPEVIENGWNGLLADEKDYKSIADLIITLIRDKNYAKELGQNNYLQAAQKTWLNYWTLQKELYHKITEL